jgi:hypothetical protein
LLKTMKLQLLKSDKHWYPKLILSNGNFCTFPNGYLLSFKVLP